MLECAVIAKERRAARRKKGPCVVLVTEQLLEQQLCWNYLLFLVGPLLQATTIAKCYTMMLITEKKSISGPSNAVAR